MLIGRDILCISSVDWDFHWQIHHEIMSTLAAEGNRVLFIENTGVRTPGVSDLGRVRQRLRNWWRSTKGFRAERPNLFVYSPLLLPFPYSRAARWFNRLFLFRPLRRWMAATGFRRPVVWTFLPTRTARDIIDEVDASLTIYYCADDFGATSHAARRIRVSEETLFAEADLVFVTSQKLYDRARQFSSRVHRFPAGVNYDQFQRAATDDDGVPSDLKALRPPIAGYVGALHQWLDQDLVAELSRRMPDISFALVGPTHSDTSRLAACANVHLLGSKPHSEIPGYIKGFDVGLVPYRVSEFTASVYPVKLNEYLAMGVPVVTTDLPEVRRFNEEHGAVLEVAGDGDEFERRIRSAIGRQSPADADRRRDVARRNSWRTRLGEMSSLIEHELAVRDADRGRWERRLQWLYTSARQRTVQIIAACLIAYLVLFETSAPWLVASPLRIAAPPRAADAIVVFAGGVGESGQAGGGYQERLQRAIELYRSGYSPRIIISSGFVIAFKEAEVMRSLGIAEGVPADAIVLETSAANTHENVLFTRAILQAHGWRSLLLVSSPYHMRRALATWRKEAPEMLVIPAPVAHSQYYAHDRGATLAQLLGIVQEYEALVYYWWKGWI